MPISQRTPPPKDHQSSRGDSLTPPELRSSSLSSFEEEGSTTPTKNVNKLDSKKVHQSNNGTASTMGTKAWRKVRETISSVSSFTSKEGDDNENSELDTSIEYDLEMTDVWLTEDSVECVLGAI